MRGGTAIIAALFGLGLAGLVTAGCAEEAGGADSDALGPDVSAAAPDVPGAEAAAPATLSVVIEASVAEGNAPLEVVFTARSEGAPTGADVTYHWTVGATPAGTGPALTRTFYLKGLQRVQVDAAYPSPGGTVAAKAEAFVRVSGCADLRPTQVSLAPPTEVAAGQEVTFKSLTIVNTGDAAQVPFSVAIYLSANEVFDRALDREVGRFTVDGIASGVFSESALTLAGRTFTVPEDQGDGTVFVFVEVDPDGGVNECREDDNVVFATNTLLIDAAAALRPDLVVSDVAVPEAPAGQGSNLGYSFAIRNVGDGPAALFRIAAWLSTDERLDPAEDRVLIGASDQGSLVPGLEPNQRLSFARSWKVPDDLPDGSYYVIVAADAEGQLIESNEANNVAASPTPVVVERVVRQCFDLALAEISVAPLKSYWEGSIRVRARVANPGSLQTPLNATLRTYLSLQPTVSPAVSTLVDVFELAPVLAGTSQEIERIIDIPQGLPVQPHYVFALLDPDGLVVECDEGNNAALFDQPVTISALASVDLAVSEVAYHPTAVAAGQPIKLAYTLANTGSSASTAFRLAVALSPDPQVTALAAAAGVDVIIYDEIVDEVPPGASQDYIVDVVVPLGLQHDVDLWWVGVIADVDANVGLDAARENNVAVALTPLHVEDAQGGCFDDAFEPNDSLNSATPVGQGLTEGLGSCGNDDWFKVAVPQGYSLAATLLAEPVLSVEAAPHDVDLELYSADGALVTASRNASDQEDVFAFVAQADAFFFLRVVSALPKAVANYALELTLLPPLDAPNLRVIDVVAAPQLLYPGGLVSLTWSEVNLGAGAIGPRVTRFYVSTDAHLDGADLAFAELLVPGMSALSVAQYQHDVVLPHTLPGGPYHLLVVADADQDVAEGDEGDNWAASGGLTLDALLVCADDALEPNDTLALATPIILAPGATVAGQVVCPQLDDWFVVEVDAGRRLVAKVSYDHHPTKGLVGVALWGPDGAPLGLDVAAEDVAQVTLPYTWQSGAWFVRVYSAGTDGAPNTYSLSLATQDPDPTAVCAGDALEPNNGPGTAARIGCGVVSATLCRGDRDHYLLPVPPDTALSVTVAQSGGEGGGSPGELRSTLFGDLNGTPLVDQVGDGALVFSAELGGDLTLRVWPAEGPLEVTNVDYTLTVAGLPGVDLAVESAGLLLGSVAAGEDELVTVVVSNACAEATEAFDVAFLLSLDGTPDAGDILLGTTTVTDGVAAMDAVELSEKVTIPYSTVAGDYRLLIVLDPDDAISESNELANAVSLALGVVLPCLPDAFEPNDVPGAAGELAPALQPPGASGLSLCVGDTDWFAVVATAGTTLTIKANFAHAEGDLDLRLYAPALSTSIPVAASDSKDDDETIVWPVAVTGVYLVRVNGFNGASAPYGLELTVE